MVRDNTRALEIVDQVIAAEEGRHEGEDTYIKQQLVELRAILTTNDGRTGRRDPSKRRKPAKKAAKKRGSR